MDIFRKIRNWISKKTITIRQTRLILKVLLPVPKLGKFRWETLLQTKIYQLTHWWMKSRQQLWRIMKLIKYDYSKHSPTRRSEANIFLLSIPPPAGNSIEHLMEKLSLWMLLAYIASQDWHAKKTCWSFFWKLLLRWKSLDRYPEEKLIHAVLEKWEIQHPAESKLFDFFDMQVSQKQVFRQKNFSELVCCFQLMKAQNEDKNHWDKKKKV